MTAYDDLTPYTYCNDLPGGLNIGWLGRDSQYLRGNVSLEFRDRLLKLAADPSNVMRGLHDCELCSRLSPIAVESKWGRNNKVILGTGEIRVVSRAGVCYVAPTLIIHYVDAHSYLPPIEFVEAVVAERDSPVSHV